jgi:hypothetical protein
MGMEILSKEFQQEVAEKLKITDVQKACYDNLSIQHFYFQKYIDCKQDLIRLERIVDKKYQELLHFYKFEYNYSITNQKELDTYIRNNEKIIELNKTLQLKKLEEEILLETIQLFKNRQYSLKNILKYQELEKK